LIEKKAYKWMGIINGVILILIWTFNLRENPPILAILVLVPNIIALIVIHRLEKKETVETLLEDTIADLTIIDNISINGFEINHKNKKTSINWKSLTSVEFNKKYTDLLINSNGKVQKIHKNAINWYKLIQSVPSSFDSFDYEYVNKLINRLTTCNICGSIAIDKKTCLDCGSSIFDNNIELDYNGEEEYLKAEQLELFATMNNDEKFDGFYSDSNNFKIDSDWTPLITEKELMEYSEREFWTSK
jgi:ribosomal protein L32